jgi:hypothetical protein
MDKKALSFEQRKVLFEQCPESVIKDNRSRHCDPLLCLFDGCRMMGVENEDVANGIANGTTCIFKKAYLNYGAELQPIQMHGFWVYAVSVEDVQQLEFEWQGSTRFTGKFRIEAKTWTFKVEFPVKEFGTTIKFKTSITLHQFPIVINHATTGHKLQGKSLNKLVVAEWSKTKNWAYVVLSRVRTLDGLFLIERIPDDIDFKPPKAYTDMMDIFRKTILKTPEDVADMKSAMDFSVL